ncbi:hypothetical protein C8R43DRAFT_1129277 [Mycena crocata]|nr:hypothetical protein C8R43DRAFT_1129277 [Mycena crocata]
MASAFLANYIANGFKSLAFSVYHRDFQAVRECSISTGSLSTFRDLRADDIMPTGVRRGRGRKFVCDLFGELLVVEDLGASRGFCLGLRCPENSVCSAAKLYSLQIAALQRILTADSDFGSNCAGSWFAAPSQNDCGDAKNGNIFIYLMAKSHDDFAALHHHFAPGQLFNISVSLQRIDTAPGDYSLLAASFISLDPDDIPRKGPTYERVTVVRLGPPLDASCRLRQMFKAQYDLLRVSLTEETRTLDASILSTWFSSSDTEGFRAMDDEFYVFLPVKLIKDYDLDDTSSFECLVVGADIELGVMLQRRDREDPSGRLELWQDRITVKGKVPSPTGYRSGPTLSLTGECLRSRAPHTAFPLMLARITRPGHKALADAEYDRDYVALRQCSIDEGSVYKFKRCPEEDSRMGFTKGYCLNYAPTLFGIVDTVLFLDKHIVVRFKCPPDATCAVLKLYAQQTAQLRRILDKDSEDLGGSIGRSWFDCTELSDLAPAMPGCFYVLGDAFDQLVLRLRDNKEVMMKVSFARLDKDNDGDIGCPRKRGIVSFLDHSHQRHMEPLRLPSADPLEPQAVVDALLKKFDFLNHTSASGRRESLEGIGEFRATVLGCIAQPPERVEDPARRNISYSLKLGCPDWSPLGWSQDCFLEIYKKQMETLQGLAYEQFSKWPRREMCVRWTDGGNIITFLGPNTHFWIPDLPNAPATPPTDCLLRGVTVVVDATFHCSWDHALQAARVFSIEALHVQQLVGKYIVGDIHAAAGLEAKTDTPVNSQ